MNTISMDDIRKQMMVKVKPKQEVNKQEKVDKVDNQEKTHKPERISTIEYTEILNSNMVCANIVDIIFDLTIGQVNKDNTMNAFTKTLITGTVKKIKEPTKEYLMKMSKEEANKILIMIQEELNKGNPGLFKQFEIE